MPADRLVSRRSKSVLRFTLKELQADPLGFLSQITRRAGDLVRYAVDDYSCVLVNDPEAIRHVLVHKNRNYIKAGTPELMMLRPILGEGLLTSEGAAWRDQRATVQPAFHRERVAAWSRMMVEQAVLTVDAWQAAVDGGASIEIEAEMTQLTLAIVAQALFGFDASGAALDFGIAVRTLNELMGHADFGDRERRERFCMALATLHQLVDNIIEERLALPGSGGNDLLSTLLELGGSETGSRPDTRAVRDQIITFLMAGHETTAKALTWTLYLLDRNPGALERLQSEIDAVLGGRYAGAEDLPDLPYAWMTIQEAMRLFPPVWTISRMAVADDEIRGFEIQSGSLILVSPYALHRHPGHWDDAERFDPTRFEPAAAARRTEYTYLPFGSGPRRCIGNVFARVESTLVLVTILQRYRLRLVEGHRVEPDALVTLRPRFGMPMLCQPRAAK